MSVVIASRNRSDHLLKAVSSCFEQDYPHIEVLVYDDASTDNTEQLIQNRFPKVRYYRSTSAVGYIVMRNRGFHDARGALVVSIDDDAYFSDASILSRTVQLFDDYPAAAAIALPFIEPLKSLTQSQLMPNTNKGTPLRGYVGCAHALRRKVVLQLGGYREFFVHQCEERDLCIRLIDNRYDIIYGDTSPIIHLFSPQRDKRRADYLGLRNTILFDFLNIPIPFVFPRLVIDLVQLLRHKCTVSDLTVRLLWLTKACWTCVRYWGKRAPVKRSTYRRYRSLTAHGPTAGIDSVTPPHPHNASSALQPTTI